MTRADAETPTRRIVVYEPDRGSELVLEVRARTLTLRPLRSRAGGEAEIVVTWSGIYDMALMRRALRSIEAQDRARPRPRRRR